MLERSFDVDIKEVIDSVGEGENLGLYLVRERCRIIFVMFFGFMMMGFFIMESNSNLINFSVVISSENNIFGMIFGDSG